MCKDAIPLSPIRKPKIKKIEFNAAVKSAFYNDLKCDESIFCAPSYSEYFPLFCDIEKELMQPLIGLINQFPSKHSENRTFRPMSKPDQSEKLLFNQLNNDIIIFIIYI